MRDVLFTFFVLAGLCATLRAPYVGLLLWVLFSLMSPHQETYLFATSVPWNLIIAIVTLGAWFASSERKSPPQGLTTILVFTLLAWTTLNTFFAFNPEFSWVYWNRTWKMILMCVVAGSLTTSMVRFQTLMWVVVLSLGYFGVKGGLFTLMTGGHFHVMGPGASMIGDNNTLAGALVMILPIMGYLREHSEWRVLRIGMIGAMVLVVTSILGSYSRGALIALALLAVTFWLRARRKLIYPVIAIIVLIPLLHFMPESFFDRAASIQDYHADESVMRRFDSWWVAYRYAMDHFPFGTGFYGMALGGVWAQYIPGVKGLACHSIYFQVLGEQGVVGLVLYLLIILSGFLNFRAVRRNTRDIPESAWARDLAGMMQLSFLTFCVAGAALPIDFFDLFFLWALLSGQLREMTRKKEGSLPVEKPFVLGLRPVPPPLGVPPT